MKGNFKPSIVAGLVCSPKLYDEFIKEYDGKHGMNIRELRFVDISMPLDNENYNKAMNELRPLICPLLSRIWAINFPFKKYLFKKAKKRGLYIVNGKDLNIIAEKSRPIGKNKFGMLGFTPLLIDDKYKNFFYDKYNDYVYNDEDRANLEKMYKFESDGFVRDTSGLIDEKTIKKYNPKKKKILR